MFVNVRKMVSIFESKKQPRPLSLPPCEQTQRENEKTTLTGASPASSASLSPAPSSVIHRPRLRAGERMRDAGGVRRVRDSWPTGKIDYYPRAGRLAVSSETKEPVKRLPHAPSKNTLAALRMSSNLCSSKATLSCTETHTAPPSGHIKSSELNPKSGSSCISNQKCQNPVWSSLTSSVRAEKGGAVSHKQMPRPSDSTLLSLLLFFHR